MKVYAMGTVVSISTTVSMDELARLTKKIPEALSLYEGEGQERHEVFRVMADNQSQLENWGACFNGATNEGMAMMTLDISDKPDDVPTKEFVAEKYGTALLRLRQVEEQFRPALESLDVQRGQIEDMIVEITL